MKKLGTILGTLVIALAVASTSSSFAGDVKFSAKKVTKILTGKTIAYRLVLGPDRSYRMRVYFESGGTTRAMRMVVKRGDVREKSKYTGKWNVKPDGTVCWTSYGNEMECRKVVEKNGRVMKMVGATEKDIEVKLFKGNRFKL